MSERAYPSWNGPQCRQISSLLRRLRKLEEEPPGGRTFCSSILVKVGQRTRTTMAGDHTTAAESDLGNRLRQCEITLSKRRRVSVRMRRPRVGLRADGSGSLPEETFHNRTSRSP